MHPFLRNLLAAWGFMALLWLLLYGLASLTISRAENSPLSLKPPSKPWTVPLEGLCRGRQKVYLDFMPGGYIKGPLEIWCMGDERPLLRVRPGECMRMNGERPETVRCADG